MFWQNFQIPVFSLTWKLWGHFPCFPCAVGLSIKIIMFPVKRPVTKKGVAGDFFFSFFPSPPPLQKWTIFSYQRKRNVGKKKFAAARLAIISADRWTGNIFFFMDSLGTLILSVNEGSQYLADQGVLVLPGFGVGVDEVFHLSQVMLLCLLKPLTRVGHPLLKVIPDVGVLVHETAVFINCQQQRKDFLNLKNKFSPQVCRVAQKNASRDSNFFSPNFIFY